MSRDVNSKKSSNLEGQLVWFSRRGDDVRGPYMSKPKIIGEEARKETTIECYKLVKVKNA